MLSIKTNLILIFLILYIVKVVVYKCIKKKIKENSQTNSQKKKMPKIKDFDVPLGDQNDEVIFKEGWSDMAIQNEAIDWKKMYEMKVLHKRRVDRNVKNNASFRENQMKQLESDIKEYKAKIMFQEGANKIYHNAMNELSDENNKLEKRNKFIEHNNKELSDAIILRDEENKKLLDELEYWKDKSDNSVHKEDIVECDWEKEAHKQHYLYQEQIELNKHQEFILNKELDFIRGKYEELKSIENIMEEHKYKKLYEENKKKLTGMMTKLNAINKCNDIDEVRSIMDDYSGRGDMVNKNYEKLDLKRARMDKIFTSIWLALENEDETDINSIVHQGLEDLWKEFK